MAWLQSVVLSALLLIGAAFGVPHPANGSLAIGTVSSTVGHAAASAQDTALVETSSGSTGKGATALWAVTHAGDNGPAPISSGLGFSDPGTSTGAVIGYIWESDPGSPPFSKFVVPGWGLGTAGAATHSYDVYIFHSGSWVFYQKANASDTVVFPAGGAPAFKVLGIDPRLGICATDHNSVWVLSFVHLGVFVGGKTPITTAVPDQNCVGPINAAEHQ